MAAAAALLVVSAGADSSVLGTRIGKPLRADDQKKLLEEFNKNGDVEVAFPLALLYKGIGLFSEKEYEKCVPFLEDALSLDSSLESGWEALGWAYYRMGEKELAIDLWTRMMRLMPEKPMPYKLLAQALVLDKDWVKADEHFRKALSLDPDQYDLRFWFAQNLLRLGKEKESERVIRALVREDPDRFDVQIMLARMLTYQQEYEEAAEWWHKITAEIPDNPDLTLEQANVELQIGETQKADELCAEILKVDPTNLRALNMRADLADISDMGQLCITRLQELVAATSNLQTRAGLRIRLASRCRMINERSADPPYTQAYIVEQYEEAIKDDPTNADNILVCAEVCVALRRYSRAKELALEVLEKFNPNNVRAKDVLYSVMLFTGHYEEADQILADRYSGFEKNSPMRLYKQANLLMEKGEYESALKLLDEMDRRTRGGCVFTLLYHQLTESDWIPQTSARRLHEHLSALKAEGFEIISPDQIPAVLRDAVRTNQTVEVIEPMPWPAKVVDGIRYSFTGERRKQPTALPDEKKVRKYVAVTFDDGSRSAFKLGTMVAQEFNTRFGMFIVTGEQDEYVPSQATWNEIREYAASDAWVIGSQLKSTKPRQPVDAQGVDKRVALSNRIWLPEKNRLESMNEWDKRMRAEFRDSLRELKKQLGDSMPAVKMAAYPFGNVGQESSCNITALRNPTRSILSEAARNYQIGFLQSYHGYSCNGDDMMEVSRYEPQWFDEGADVVRHAYQSHPVFMARILRVALAYRQNKPYLAKQMIALLKEDGYPADLCRQMEIETFAQFTGKPERGEKPLVRRANVTTGKSEGQGPVNEAGGNTAVQANYSPEQRAMGSATTGTMPDQESEVLIGEERPWFHLNSPYLGGEVFDSKSNGEMSKNGFGIRGGLNINDRSSFGLLYSSGVIKQKTTLTVENPDYDTGAPSTSTKNPKYLTEDATYRSEISDIRGRYAYRFDSGAVLAASIGQASFDLDKDKSSNRTIVNRNKFANTPSNIVYKAIGPRFPSESGEDGSSDSAIVGDLAFIFSPLETITLRAYYLHDIVSSAYEQLQYDSVGFDAKWLFTDNWHLGLGGQYWIYDDNNAMTFGQIESFWRTIPEMGIWCGLRGSVITSAQDDPFYWTPYWDERVDFILRYRQEYPGYFFNFDALVGVQRSGSRSNAIVDSGQDWEPGFGFAANYQRRMWRSWDVFIDVRTMVQYTYTDHSFRIGGIYNF